MSFCNSDRRDLSEFCGSFQGRSRSLETGSELENRADDCGVRGKCRGQGWHKVRRHRRQDSGFNLSVGCSAAMSQTGKSRPMLSTVKPNMSRGPWLHLAMSRPVPQQQNPADSSIASRLLYLRYQFIILQSSLQ